MAVQKRKKSKAMRDHRRAQWMRSVPLPTVGICPKCQEPRIPHRACANCGHYNERKVVDVGEAAE